MWVTGVQIFIAKMLWGVHAGPKLSRQKRASSDRFLGFGHWRAGACFFPAFNDAIVVRMDGAADPVPPAEVVRIVIDEL